MFDAAVGLPAPLTSPGCDLRDELAVPIEPSILLASEAWVLGTAEERVALVTLLCAAWHQVPAASVPDHDGMLAHLSGAGTAWAGLREHVMRDWVRCSDGRLYHPLIAGRAAALWEARLAARAEAGARLARLEVEEAERRRRDEERAAQARERTAKAREARARNRAGAAASVAPSVGRSVRASVATSVTDTATETVTERPTETVTEPDRETGAEARAHAIAHARVEDKFLNSNSPPSSSEGRVAVPAPPAEPKATRIPANWEPGEEGTAFAAEREFDEAAIAEMADDFRDHFRAKSGPDARKADWMAAWRRWVRTTVERRKGTSHRAAPLAPDLRGSAATRGPDWWKLYPHSVEADGRVYVGRARRFERDEEGRPVGEPRFEDGVILLEGRLTGEVLAAAGMAGEGIDWAPLGEWLRDCIDLEYHVLPAIREVAAKPGYRPPGSLRYFDRAVRERFARVGDDYDRALRGLPGAYASLIRV